MLNEEKEYQDFMVKTLKASKELLDDYAKLSDNNKARFHQDLKNQAKFDVLMQVVRFIQS